MIRVTVPVVALVAVVLAATGCGGSKKSSSTAATTPAATTPAATTPATTTQASSGSSSSSGSTGGTDTTSSSSSSSGSGSSTIAKSCLDFASAASKLGQAFAQGASGAGNTDQLKAFYANLADKAPSSIKAAFQTIADAVSKYADALKKANIKPGSTPSAADMAKLQGALKSIGTPQVEAASKKIEAWVQAGCHS